MTEPSETEQGESERRAAISLDSEALVRTRQAATGGTIRVLTTLHGEILAAPDLITDETGERQHGDTMDGDAGPRSEKDDPTDISSSGTNRRWHSSLLLSSPCSCDGERVGLRDWLRRLTGKSHYNYKIEPYPAQGENDYYFMARYRRDAEDSIGWYLCDCGRWVVHPQPPETMPYRVKVRDFKSERAADEYVRRLRHGVPQRYELLMILAAGIGGALPYIIVEIVRAL